MEKKLLLGDEAIALEATHAGICGVYAYPGTPEHEITGIHPTASVGACEVCTARGVRTKRLPSRQLWGILYAGARVIACMKHVGLNVAADTVNAAITGVNGGMIVVVADDPSMHSSQNEQDSRFYGKFSMITTLEPSTQQEAHYTDATWSELSEREKLPVLMRIVMRLAHSRAAVTVKEEAEEVRARPCEGSARLGAPSCQFAPEICRIAEQQPRLEQAAAEALTRISFFATNRLGRETCGAYWPAV